METYKNKKNKSRKRRRQIILLWMRWPYMQEILNTLVYNSENR